MINELCIDLAGLTRVERRILRLHDVYRMPVIDMADALEMTPAEVKRGLRRARIQYRKCYYLFGFGKILQNR